MSRTPALMIQGTSSNAGKTLLCTALCRVFMQAGYRTAPFKAQNMTGSGFTLPDGQIMSGAQALQAVAARRAPEPRMNPVMLRPVSTMGSEVILMGENQGPMSVREYIRYKETAFAHVKTAYDSLANEVDVMILEGAGSPAEINLRQNDIVNMSMAAYADAVVLLAGDIDRGGVFAHFLGTVELLDAQDRARIQGFIINKFRGDARLLESALVALTQRTGIPFIGVVPYMEHNLPQEDSLAIREHGSGGLELTDPRVETELDRLADTIRNSLDMKKIFTLLGLSGV